MLDGVLLCELSEEQRERLEQAPGALGREPSELASEWIREKLREAADAARPSPDQGPELHC